MMPDVDLAGQKTGLRGFNRWWPLLLLAVFFIIVGGGYLAHYRVAPGITLAKLERLTINDIPPGSSLYIDNTDHEVQKGGSLTLELLPGDHTILGSADGYWPWKALVTLSTSDTTIDAFFIPSHITIEPANASAKADIALRIKNYQLPSAAHPLLLLNGCESVYLSENRIIADVPTAAGCTPAPFLCTDNSCAPTIIFSPVEPIASIIKYPGREDALLVSLGSHVYALALDPRDPRAFAPVLESRAPVVIDGPNGSVVGKDLTTYFTLDFSTHVRP